MTPPAPAHRVRGGSRARPFDKRDGPVHVMLRAGTGEKKGFDE